MRTLHAASLSFVAFSAVTFALALVSLSANDDLAALFWGTAAALALATSGRLSAPKSAT